MLCKIKLVNPRMPHQKKEMVPRAPATTRLKSEVSIMLRCQLCSTRYTAVRIKNCLKNTSAIKVAIMKNTDDFLYEGKPSHATAKSTFFAVSKDEWDTKEDTGKSMKNTSVCQKVPLGLKQRQKRKPVALADIELCLSEGIGRSGNQSVPRKFRLII